MVSFGNRDFYPLQSLPMVLDLFQGLIEKDLKILYNQALTKKHNLTKSEFLALDALSKNKEVVIRNADGGGAIIVLDSGLYNKLNRLMLDDITTYKPLRSDPTQLFSQILKLLLQEGVTRGAISVKMAEDLLNLLKKDLLNLLKKDVGQ